MAMVSVGDTFDILSVAVQLCKQSHLLAVMLCVQ